MSGLFASIDHSASCGVLQYSLIRSIEVIFYSKSEENLTNQLKIIETLREYDIDKPTRPAVSVSLARMAKIHAKNVIKWPRHSSLIESHRCAALFG